MKPTSWTVFCCCCCFFSSMSKRAVEQRAAARGQVWGFQLLKQAEPSWLRSVVLVGFSVQTVIGSPLTFWNSSLLSSQAPRAEHFFFTRYCNSWYSDLQDGVLFTGCSVVWDVSCKICNSKLVRIEEQLLKTATGVRKAVWSRNVL